VSIDYAVEHGFTSRGDTFHFQEARRMKAVFLTEDTDFLDNIEFFIAI